MPKFLSVRGHSKLRLHSVTKVYYVYLGKNVYKSAKTKSRKEATAKCSLIESRFHKGTLDKLEYDHNDLILEVDEFLDLKKDKAKSTFQRWESICRLYVKPYITKFKLRPSQFNVNQWTKYIREVRRRRPQLTFSNHQKVWTMIVGQLYDKSIIDRKPEFYNPDPESEAGRSFTKNELRKILVNAGDDLKLQILLGIDSPRLRENLRLRHDQINFEHGCLILRDIKTNKGKIVPVGVEALVLLKARLENGSEYVFPSPKDNAKPVNDNRHAWRSACDKAGIIYVPYKCRYHDLRGFAITEMLKEHGDVYQVSKIAGNSKKVIKRHYDRIDPEHLSKFRNKDKFLGGEK